MSTSPVTPNTDTGSVGAAIVATDGCVFTLNETYASPGLIVATAAQGRAPERAQTRRATPLFGIVIGSPLHPKRRS
jgi:hypothetical protein